MRTYRILKSVDVDKLCADLKEALERLYAKDKYIEELLHENRTLKDQLADLALKKRKGKRKR